MNNLTLAKLAEAAPEFEFSGRASDAEDLRVTATRGGRRAEFILSRELSAEPAANFVRAVYLKSLAA